MKWISDNYKWLFDGVGGAAVIALIVFLIQRLLKTSPQPAGQTAVTLESQDSSLSNSPLASGSGNIQNVNAPVINVNIGQPAAAPAQAEPTYSVPAPRERPLPNMVATGAHVVGVTSVEEGVWKEWHGGYDAFTIQFTDEARRAGQNVGGLVKAQLIYRDGVRELRRTTGCWLNQAADMTEFRVDDTHYLMVGLMLERQFRSVGKRRVRVDLNTDEIHTDLIVLPGFEKGTVSVRLTHASSGDVLYEGQFQLNTHPPAIIRL